MARLTESQLAGFRTGTGTPAAAKSPRPRRGPKAPPDDVPAQHVRTDQPALALTAGTPTTPSSLGPVPPAPTRSEPRQKVGLTLPLKLAEQARATTRQGYALADLVMVAYQHHRDALVEDRQRRSTRQLERRAIGRSSFTVVLSVAERDALDALAQYLGTTRSHAIALLLERQLSSQQTDTATETETR
jgi:hypothetical protein